LGGYGSGRRADKFVAMVEDCCSVKLYGNRGNGVSPVCRRSVRCHLSSSAKMDARAWWCSQSPHMHMRCTGSGNKDSEQIELVATLPFYGGQRFWLICPSCQHRVTSLYCLGSFRRFLCRTCHRLTYRSCRGSHLFDWVIAKVRRQGQSRAEVLRSIRELSESIQRSGLIGRGD
jgi:hypothetical protein